MRKGAQDLPHDHGIVHDTRRASVVARYSTHVTTADSDAPPPKRKSRAFFFVRVAILLGVLAVVIMYAAQDTYRRKHRNDWDHTLEIALVVLERGSVDPKAIARMRERLPALEARLTEELHNRRPEAPPPFHFSFFGPVSVDAPPALAQSEEVSTRVREMYEQWRTFDAIDGRAEVHARAFDSRVYVTVRRPASKELQRVEGASEENGRIATVEVELAEETADLALIVSAHELLHTVGASDKYDALGRTAIPEGLCDPDAKPLYPQKRAEIMARNRMVAVGKEEIPTKLDQLGVGPVTAREIGWTPP